jgi:hypothetical protein
MNDMSYKFGFWSGRVLGILIVLFCIFGSFYMIFHKEFPFAPLALLFSFWAWKNSVFNKSVLLYNLDSAKDNVTPEDVENIVNIVNYKNSIGLGPN